MPTELWKSQFRKEDKMFLKDYNYFFNIFVKVGSHDPIFGANYYSNSK